MASRTENVKRNMRWALVNSLVSMILPFINKTVMIYTIGVEYTGVNSLFTSTLSMLSLAELGFGAAVVFSMYKPVADGDDNKVCALLNLYKKVYRIIGLIILAVGVALIPFLRYLIKGDIPEGMNIYILYIPYLADTVLGYLLFAYRGSLYEANQRKDIPVKAGLFIGITKNVLQFIALAVFRNFYMYAFVSIPMTLLSNVITYVLTKKYFPRLSPKGKLEKNEIDGIKDRVSGVFIHKVCATFRNSADSMIISAFLGLVALAKYQYYYYIVVILLGFMGVITSNLIPSIGNSIASETKEKNYNDFKKFFFIYEWIIIWWTVCLACLYQPFVKIWIGEKMLMSYSAVAVFCAYFFAAKTGDMVYIYREAAGLWSKDKMRPVVETITNVVLSIIFVNKFGVVGVLAATVICLVVINYGWGSQILFKYYFERSAIEYYLSTAMNCVVLVVTGVITYSVCSLVSGDDVICLIMKFIICAILPNILIFILCFWRKEFRDAMAFVRKQIKK